MISRASSLRGNGLPMKRSPVLSGLVLSSIFSAALTAQAAIPTPPWAVVVARMAPTGAPFKLK
jgi:hypothetical protein